MLNLATVRLRLIRGSSMLRVLREEAEPLNVRIRFLEDEIENLTEREAELQEDEGRNKASDPVAFISVGDPYEHA